MATIPKKTSIIPPETDYRLVELRAKNFKILKAVSIKVDGTVFKISGRNEQGKSSVLDAVAAAIGGKDAFPEQPLRKGEKKGELYCDFGALRLTRRFWEKDDGGIGQELNLDFADGKAPTKKQDALDALRGSSIADDPIEFARMKPKERFDLVKALVKNFDFEDMAAKRKELFEARTAIGRDHERAKGAAASIVVPPNAPKLGVDVTELAAELRAAGEHNALVDKRAEGREQLAEKIEALRDQADALMAQAKAMNAEAEQLDAKLKGAEALPAKISTVEIEQKIADAETINNAARLRAQRDKLEAAATELGEL